MINEHFVGTVLVLSATGILLMLLGWARHSTEGNTRQRLVMLLEREGFLNPIFVYLEETESYCALAEARMDGVPVRLNISPHPDRKSIRVLVTDCCGFNGMERIICL